MSGVAAFTTSTRFQGTASSGSDSDIQIRVNKKRSGDETVCES